LNRNKLLPTHLDEKGPLWFGCVSLFPDMFQALHYGVVGRALEQGLLSVATSNPRQFAKDRYQRVDDYPYGGGAGMVMMAEPLQQAVSELAGSAPVKPYVVYLSPQGRVFDQAAAEELLQKRAIILIAGRYEGIDERVIENVVDAEWSVGDFVLSGGEFAAMTIIDVMTRLLPGAVGDRESVETDSITTGLLKYPQYTRPDIFQGQEVPTVLLSGHHQAIAKWRLQQSLGRTWLKKPALLAKRNLTSTENALLTEFISDYMENNTRKTD
jgi:tRNA (guanine37-N1)-methyltransferase